MLGEFDFSDEKLQDTIGVLPPPKSRSKSFPKIGRREIDDVYAVSIGYRKSYVRFGTFEPLGPIFIGYARVVIEDQSLVLPYDALRGETLFADNVV